MPGDWSRDLPTHAPVEPDDGHLCGCTDPACPTDRVAEAGVLALAEHAGFKYDDLNPHQKVHYKLIVSDVFAAMSQAMLDAGVVKEQS